MLFGRSQRRKGQRLPRRARRLPLLPRAPLDPALHPPLEARSLRRGPADVMGVLIGCAEIAVKGHSQEWATGASTLTH